MSTLFLLRPRVLSAAAVLVASLACTCDPTGGGATGGEREEAAPEPRPAPRAKGKKAPADLPEDGEVEMPAGVEYLGDQKWQVKRKTIDRYVEKPEALGCNAREKGKGYELVGVQVQDDAYALGARNHDLVLSINGKSLDDPADLINVYLQLADADKLSVVLERAGEKRTHTYLVVD